MAAITAIYAHHVLTGLASFELTPPDIDEMRRRRDEVITRGFRYLVAELDCTVVGYSYANLYRTRPAYRYCVEDSVYVGRDYARQGIGRALLPALIEACTAAGCRQMVAVIGDSANHPSILLHERFGFARAGLLHAVGFKFGRWVDSVLMQRALGGGADSLPDGASPLRMVDGFPVDGAL